jgi:Cof subfamily protein (haloacid dehalogenase superfamily)
MRLVATDLDGTLLRSDGSVSDRTRGALAAAGDAGIEVALVTARNPRGLAPVAEAAGFEGRAICCNGALVYDVGARRVVATHELAAEVAGALVAKLRERAPGVAFAVERDSLAIREPAYVPLWPTPDEHPRTDALVAVSEPVVKLVAQHPELSQADLYALAVELAGTDAAVTYSGERLVEISAAGVTKAFALEGLGVPAADVVAFGDMPNDVPMLEWAGHGVAVANAHPDAIAAADEIAPANDDDGVAVVLERLLGYSMSSSASVGA